jgi:carbon monoxide dehydrogenase subunit G
LLSEPATVAACMPGATLAPDKGDGLWRGSVKVRFGPTIAVFKGEATLAYDHLTHRCSIDGRGIDGRGASRALAAAVVQATAEGDTTRLAVAGSFTVTGPLETFANAGGVHVARALLAEFSANMAKLVAERRPVQPATPPEPVASHSAAAPEALPTMPPPPAELSAFSLLWRALQSWLRSLFAKGKS